jgi:hypothetical protein
MGDGGDFDPAIGEETRQLVELKSPHVVQLDVAKLCSGTRRDELPGDDVGVVLHIGEEDHVSVAEVLPSPTRSHKVDRLGRPTGPDHLR